MGAAGSARAINAEQYDAMAAVLSPDSRAQIPDTDTALGLLQDFEALSLGESGGGGGGGASHFNLHYRTHFIIVLHKMWLIILCLSLSCRFLLFSPFRRQHTPLY